MKSLRWNLVIVFVFLTLFAVLPLQSFAQQTMLEVKCLDASGAPVAGVKVVIDPMDTHKVKDKKSDGKGIAEFKVDNGVYRIFGRKEGLAPALFEYAVVKGGARQSASLSFQQGDMMKKLPFEDPALQKQAAAMVQQANDLLRGQKVAEAEKEYLAAIDLNAADPEAHLNLALAFLQQAKWEPADSRLKKAAELADALQLLGGSTQPLYRGISERAHDLQVKLPMIRLRNEADKALSARKFDEAAAKYAEALKLDSNDPDLYYNMGLALANAKKFEEANQSIDKAIQLMQEAIQRIQAAIGALPEGPQKAQETARLSEHLPEMNKSLAAYNELKKRAADFRENEILRKAQGILTEGDTLFNSGDYAGALKKYEEARPLVPAQKQSIVYAQMAKTYAQLKQGDQAVANFRKAMELSPGDDNVRKALAQYYLNEKKYEDALNVYAEAGSVGQADQALFALGQKLNNQGNAEVAALAFEKVIQANPQNAEAYYELGMLLFYDKDKKSDAKARAMLEKYVQIGKNSDHVSNTNNVLVVLKRRMSK